MSSYKCSGCNYTSEVKGNVKRHIANMCKKAELIEDIVKLQCDICNKVYETETALISHKKTCVAKKAVVVKEYTDAVEVMDKIKNLTLLVNSLISSNEQISNENKELKKRVEKLEKIDKKINENLIDVAIDCEEVCQYNHNKGVRVVSREQVYEYFGWDTDEAGKMCDFLIGERVEKGKIHASYIKANGVCYNFDDGKKKKGEKYATDLIIYDVDDCSNSAAKFSNKHQQYCCEEHENYFE